MECVHGVQSYYESNEEVLITFSDKKQRKNNKKERTLKGMGRELKCISIEGFKFIQKARKRFYLGSEQRI